MNMKLRQISGTFFIIVTILMVFYLYRMKSIESFVDTGRCGVGMPSCSGERIRCINGYCKSDIPKRMPLLSDLPIVP
jgi:hypothetical protein